MRVLIHQPWKTWGAIAISGVVVTALWPHADSRAQQQKAEASGTSKPAPAVPVKVATVLRQDQSLSLQAVGQIHAARQAVVRARIEGLLTEVSFTEGQRVRQGQVLARLDDRSLRAQVSQAQGDLRRLRAQLELARLELQRAQSLLKESAVSAQQRDQQLAQVAQLEAQVQAQEASVAQIQTQLSYTVITAPFSGQVGLRQVDVGNVVRPSDGQGLVTLVQASPTLVVFPVPQSRLGDVRQALSREGGALVRVAEREGGPVLAQGRLRASDSAVDAGSGTLKLKAELAASGERLWPGQFVTVNLETGVLQGAISVPTRAVQRGLKGSFVWRVVEGQAQIVPIQVRWQSDEMTVVEPKPAPQGLQPGDRVVIDGQSRLKPKATVKLLGA